MLNGAFLNGQAAELANRLRREAPGDARGQVALALRLALCRPAERPNIERGLAFIKSLQDEHGVDASKALDYYCLMVFNLNEFVYVD
jgi:hypothetical protein